MESQTKKILMPAAGICNLTPDKVCNDSELLDSQDITFSDDALRIVRPPQKVLTGTSGTLAYVHLTNDGTEHYIYTDGSSFNNINVGAVITSVTAIGNMLILNTTQGLRYYLWKPDAYHFMGNKIPLPDIRLRMSSVVHNDDTKDKRYFVTTYEKMQPWFGNDDAHTWDGKSFSVIVNSSEGNDSWDDLVLGMYAEVKKRAARKNWFTRPFMVRYALELQGGAYTAISNPILMAAAMRHNHMFTFDFLKMVFITDTINTLILNILPRELQYKFSNAGDFKDWTDIVKKVVIFASPEVEIYNTDETNAASVSNILGTTTKTYNVETSPLLDSVIDNGYHSVNFSKSFSLLSNRSTKNVLDDLSTTGVFYRIAEIGLSDTDGYVRLPMKDDTIDNLTSQPRLDNDDFFSHCPLFPDIMRTFNRRLNITAVRRGFFEGFAHFSDYGTESHYYTASVTIATPTGDKIVTHNYRSSETYHQNMWFYYPDPRAKSVVIKAGDTEVLRASLKEHPRLNGAYYIGTDFINGSETAPAGSQEASSLPAPELLPNYILQSEVDNPFTFLSSGYVRVGQGKIIGMAALTTALSQDAYKVATTLAFTTQGIWALSTDTTGQYAAVAPPFSREVCNNPQSITMADNTVFFTSEKGLMMITDDGIRNVTHQLSGKNPPSPFPEALPPSITPFRTFLKTCRLAYDYRNNHLWLLPAESEASLPPAAGSASLPRLVPEASPSGPTSQRSAASPSGPHAYLYNINSATVTRVTIPKPYKAIVPNYPDTLLQTTDGELHSMLSRPDINDDESRYNATFITRPIKFGESIKLKSLREFLHIHDLSDGATLTVTIYTSNDCKTWHEQTSLYGAGAKFFTFRFDFRNLKAVDTYSGTLIGYDTRQTYKSR